MVSLVATRQLARVPLAVATQVRQELHALAERAQRLVKARPGSPVGEAQSLFLLVDRYVAHVDIQPAERVVTLREVDVAG
jgi:hypothetical protein